MSSMYFITRMHPIELLACLQVVEQRDELVNMLEKERLKERQEDEAMQEVMLSKGFELSPVPYSRVTLKKGYKAPGSRHLRSQ